MHQFSDFYTTFHTQSEISRDPLPHLPGKTEVTLALHLILLNQKFGSVFTSFTLPTILVPFVRHLIHHQKLWMLSTKFYALPKTFGNFRLTSHPHETHLYFTLHHLKTELAPMVECVR